MFPLSCFRLARTAFSYWRTIGITHECYCSRGRPMRARRNKIRGNIGPMAKVLLHAAKLYLSTVYENKELAVVHISDSDDASAASLSLTLTSLTSLQRFKFLANKISSSRLTTANARRSVSERDTIHMQLNNYIADIMEEEINHAMKFWGQKLTRCSKLNDLAQDFL